jgi:hypothetical protein
MENVKRLFFEPHEIVWQLHVPVNQHISGRKGGSGRASHCLHLWRKHDFKMPLPPRIFIDV